MSARDILQLLESHATEADEHGGLRFNSRAINALVAELGGKGPDVAGAPEGPPQWMLERAESIAGDAANNACTSAELRKAVIEAMQEAGREVAFYFAGGGKE